MNIEVINKELTLNIYGFSGTAINKDYAGTAFKLMDRMWKIVKSTNLKNKGMNIWVYEPGEQVFAGVELQEVPQHDTGLEHKNILLTKYAYFKHIGPYQQIPEEGKRMQSELKSQGFEVRLPYIEIYGHWTGDETKLETELLMHLK